jgi:hypothetical protein
LLNKKSVLGIPFGILVAFAVLGLIELIPEQYKVFQVLGAFLVLLSAPVALVLSMTPTKRECVQLGAMGYTCGIILTLGIGMYNETKTPQYLAEQEAQKEARQRALEYDTQRLAPAISEAEEWRVVSNLQEAGPKISSGVQMLVAQDNLGVGRIVFLSIGSCGSGIGTRVAIPGDKIKITRQVISAGPDWEPGKGEQVLYFAHHCGWAKY